jgi:hypothetical protein
MLAFSSVIQPNSLFLTGVLSFFCVLGFWVLMSWSLALKDPRRGRLQSAFCESEIQQNWGLVLAKEGCSYIVYR